MTLEIWRGQRPQLKRSPIWRHEAVFGQLGFTAASESLAHSTDWCFEESHHTIVVHLDGHLDMMQMEMSGGPAGCFLPDRGDIWIIPANRRYSALARGDRAQFLEIRVPTRLLLDCELSGRVQAKDPFL